MKDMSDRHFIVCLLALAGIAMYVLYMGYYK